MKASQAILILSGFVCGLESPAGQTPRLAPAPRALSTHPPRTLALAPADYAHTRGAEGSRNAQ